MTKTSDQEVIQADREAKVIHATLRDGDGEIHIECRFDDGQKFAAIVVDDQFPQLAEDILAFITTPPEKPND